MEQKDKQAEEIEAYEESCTENLTLNDALILIAVCAAKERVEIDENQKDDAKRIAALAKKHPIFSDLEDSIDPAINKFMNMIGTKTDLVNLAQSAAKTLNTAEKTFEQDFGEVAFSWAAEIIMPDGVLSEKRKNIIDKYVLLLDIDNTVARQIQVDVSR